MKGVILAAGDGTRLHPLTLQYPKPLIRVLGRPLLDYTIDAFVAAGIRDLILVVGYKAEQICAWVGDGSRYGARLTCVLNPEYELENATSLYAARAAVGNSPFILTMADHMIARDILRRLLEQGDGMDTLCVDSAARYAPQLNDATRVWVDASGLVRHIGKGLTRWNAVDTGAFFLTPRIFAGISALRRIGNANPNLSDSVTWLIERGVGVRGCDVAGAWWTDVDTLEDLRSVEAEFNQVL